MRDNAKQRAKVWHPHISAFSLMWKTKQKMSTRETYVAVLTQRVPDVKEYRRNRVPWIRILFNRLGVRK